MRSGKPRLRFREENFHGGQLAHEYYFYPTKITRYRALPSSPLPPNSEAIPVDYYRGKPLCMHHYQLYSKCRIPGPTADTLRTTPINESRHVIVIRNGYVSERIM